MTFLKTMRILFALIFLAGITSSCEKDDISETATDESSSSLKSMSADGTISAQYSDSPSGEDISKVFDCNINTKYLTFHDAVWLQWQGESLLGETYSITSANDFAGRDPKAWTLYGSNDGATWTELDQQTDQTFSERFQRKTYTLSDNAPYSYYKLDITENNGATITQLAEWDIYGSSSSVIATIYEDCGYGGYSVDLSEGCYNREALEDLGVVNNDISSLTVTSGYKITLYDGEDFTGDYIVKTADASCIVENGFNDKASSIIVEVVTSSESIDDLLALATSYTASSSTPMGVHYEGLHETTDDDREWLANADNQPSTPSGLVSSLHWEAFSVTLYPYGTPSPADINQHNIGDCGGISALASLAYLAPDFIVGIINDNGDGTYNVAMFDPQGEPVTVVVDSEFLADSDGNLAAVSGKNSVATWSTILEKAIMKYNVIYEADATIEGIGSENVLPLFTGNGSSFAFGRNVLTADELQLVVKECLAMGKFIIGGFGQVLPIDDVQTVTGHAYTIVLSNDSDAIFSMRNPWGLNPLVAGGYETASDGVLDIPAKGDVPATIDLRIVDMGIAGSSGTTTTYTPPTQTLKSTQSVRISERLLQSGM